MKNQILMRYLIPVLSIMLFTSCANSERPKRDDRKNSELAAMQQFDTFRYVGTMSFRSTALRNGDTAFRDTVVVVKMNQDSAYCSWNYPYDSNQLFFSRIITLPLEIQPLDLYEFETRDKKENSFLQLLFLNGRVEITDTVDLKNRHIRRAQHFAGKKI